MVSRFFDNIRDYSEIKLRILRRFLTPWAAKLGSIARDDSKVIWYVDGFAGAGKYDDGTEGSPLIGLRRAEEINTANRGYQLACSFVESKRANWRSLEELCEPFRAMGITANNKLGEFAEVIPEIRSSTAGSAILLFVDPFGIAPIKYQEFRTLLNRPWPIDVILNFSHRAVYRLATDHPHLITEAIGSDSWRRQWALTDNPELRARYVLDEFRQNMKRDGRFHNVLYYPIRPAITASPRYYLVFASRHYDAFELWNDEIAQEEVSLSIKQYSTLLIQASFLPEFDNENRGVNLLNEISAFTTSLKGFTRQEIVRHLVEHRWGQYHTRDIKKAVGSLVESGKIKRLHVVGKGIDTDEMTTA